MNIVYASDNNFAEILGISMISLFENNKDCDEITVYILEDEIDESNKLKLSDIASEYSRKIFFIDVDSILNSGMKQQRGSLSTFSRLYLAELLPSEVNRVLYLDCDLLVLHSLSELYEIDMTDCCIVGINDCVSKQHKSLVDLEKNDNYFNAGVLLIDVNKWRKTVITKKFTLFSRNNNDNVSYADQGIINGVSAHESKFVDLKYNCYTVLFDFAYKDLMIFRKPTKYYSENEVENARKNPAIVHFTTSFLSLRPWIEGCKHPYVGEWLKYKAMSPWADIPLRKDNRSGKKKFAVKIYKALPKVLSVRIAGLLHSKIVPMMRGLRK